jgi:vanillate O-demethylase monooxygenase subunit
MPFLRNSWYGAGWADDIDAPQRRVICGKPIVLYRDGTARINALLDICPHRAASLSMGRVSNGNIMCPYHGLEFDRSGTCVANPHVEGPPGGLKVRQFAVAERYGAIWVWMGDPAASDEALLPNFPILDDPSLTVQRGHTVIAANYQLVIDNLLDLSHGEYLHAGTLGTPGAARSMKANARSTDRGVAVDRMIFNNKPNPLFAKVWTKSQRVDQQSNIEWVAPSTILLDIFATVAGGARSEGINFPQLHLVVPETETTTNYYFAIGRDFAVGDPSMSAVVMDTARKAFEEEDRPIIEACQVNIDMLPSEAVLRNFTIGDGASKRARSMLQRMLANE